MHKLSLILFFNLAFSSMSAQSIPSTFITNGLIDTEVYLPNIEKGYYRATRFDWSGVIPTLNYKGHTYFGKWFKKYDPNNHESIMGPVEEFGVIGYEQAELGGDFLKIGVGILTKPQEDSYSKFKTYEIRDHGSWQTSIRKNEVVFTHELKSDVRSYAYEKTMKLPDGEAKLIISHSLTNIGNERITTSVYNHNFYQIDSLNSGKGYVVKFPYEISIEANELGDFVDIEGNELVFTKNLGETDSFYIGDITSLKKNERIYEFSIENRVSKAGVNITANRPLSKLAFWSSLKAVCPEPFIALDIAPGDTATWEIVYQFYEF